MTKITKEEAQTCINDFATGLSYEELAKRHNLSNRHLRALIAGRARKELDRPQEVYDRIEKNKERSRHRCLLPLTENQLNIITGTMLGDGSIRKPDKDGGHCRFTFAQTVCKKFGDRQEYVKALAEKLKPYSLDVRFQRRKNKKGTWVFQTGRRSVFSDLEQKWYLRDDNGDYIYRIVGDKKHRIKTVPLDIKLPPISIAIWYCDDGSNSYEYRNATLHTQGFSENDVVILEDKLKDYNIIPVIYFKESVSDGRKQPVLHFYGSSYDNLIDVVKPFILWDCFNHKTKWRSSKYKRRHNVLS